jgi:hypothetical protein
MAVRKRAVALADIAKGIVRFPLTASCFFCCAFAFVPCLILSGSACVHMSR